MTVLAFAFLVVYPPRIAHSEVNGIANGGQLEQYVKRVGVHSLQYQVAQNKRTIDSLLKLRAKH